MSYTKDVKARIHEYFHDNPGKVLWRNDLAKRLDMSVEQVRNGAGALVAAGIIEVIERAHAWRYNVPTATIDLGPVQKQFSGQLYVIRRLASGTLICVDDNGDLYTASKIDLGLENGK